MSDRPFPVLWVCGPSGVGKTSAGFEVFDRLRRTGTEAAYVDLDQLGLCDPAPADDPRDNRLRARNLGSAWAAFRAAGARCLVVSGIVDDAEVIRRHVEPLTDTALTVVRLRVGPAELRERFRGRGHLLHLTEESVRNAEELDRSDFADHVIDTGALSVAEVADRICGTGWPGQLPPSTVAALPPVPASLPVLFLHGPRAMGKSTVGFEIFQQVIGSGVKAAYVDLAQIGFCHPPADVLTLAGRLAEAFREAGAQRLIVSGNLTVAPPETWTVCRLRAGPEALAERFEARKRGEGAQLAGASLSPIPDRPMPDDLVLDTDGRAAPDIARAALSYWLRG